MKLSPTVLNGSEFLHSVLTEKKASVMMALPRSVSAMTKALPLSHGVLHGNECMADDWLHARMQLETGCHIEAAVQVVAKALSALSKSIGLGSFQAAYSH